MHLRQSSEYHSPPPEKTLDAISQQFIDMVISMHKFHGRTKSDTSQAQQHRNQASDAGNQFLAGTFESFDEVIMVHIHTSLYMSHVRV